MSGDTSSDKTNPMPVKDGPAAFNGVTSRVLLMKFYNKKKIGYKNYTISYKMLLISRTTKEEEKMICCGIYKFTERSTGKVYIGQSKDIYGRYGLHYFHSTNKEYNQLSPIDQALFDNPSGFDFEIVELCEEHELASREAYWIEFYDSQTTGFNIMTQHKVYQFTKEGELINCYNGYSEAARAIGKPEGKGNIYHCCQGSINSAYGYKWSYYSDLKDKQSLPIMSKQKNSGHSTKKRMVLQLTTDGELVQKYSSCAEAARAVGVTGPAIMHACNGRSKTCKGYVWKYNEESWEQQ